MNKYIKVTRQVTGQVRSGCRSGCRSGQVRAIERIFIDYFRHTIMGGGGYLHKKKQY